MRLEPALPVAVAERRRARRDRELLRHEVVVRDRVGGEVREVAERERAQRLVVGAVVDLQPDGPRVTVPARRRVLLRDARVGGDRAVQEIVREGAQQLGDRRRAADRSDRMHRFAEEDVRARRPGVRRRREQHERCAREQPAWPASDATRGARARDAVESPTARCPSRFRWRRSALRRSRSSDSTTSSIALPRLAHRSRARGRESRRAECGPTARRRASRAHVAPRAPAAPRPAPPTSRRTPRRAAPARPDAGPTGRVGAAGSLPAPIATPISAAVSRSYCSSGSAADAQRSIRRGCPRRRGRSRGRATSSAAGSGSLS